MTGKIIKNEIILPEIENHKDKLLKIKHLLIIGSGSSLNAGQIGCEFLRTINQFDTIQLFDSSEFNMDIVKNLNKTEIGVICISQSGETKDTSLIVDLCNNQNITILSIVNVANSYISSNTICLHTNAGREVGVAATKSFTSQCIIFKILELWFKQLENCNIQNQLVNIKNLSSNIENILNNKNIYEIISKTICNAQSIFILGNNYTKHVAIEGALKIKEITYIHTEGFLSASLKHGTFSLIQKDTPIIYIDVGSDSIEITAAQTKCRHSMNILITDKPDVNEHLYDYIIKIPHNKDLYNILSIIPIQLLAYQICIDKNINPDFPKNLAKTVTVI